MFLNYQHHIAIICSDEARALDFYVNKLGFEIALETFRPQQQDVLRMLKKGEVVLELFIKPDAPERPSYPEALGLRHLCFRVEDVEAAVRWLNSRGIQTGPILDDPFNHGRLAFFHDPDGLPLEVHE